MNTCGTCKFWGSPTLEEDPIYRSCGALHHDKYGLATEEITSDDTDEEISKSSEAKKQLAVVVDGSGYYAALKTREDFGCILWMAKEASL